MVEMDHFVQMGKRRQFRGGEKMQFNLVQVFRY